MIISFIRYCAKVLANTNNYPIWLIILLGLFGLSGLFGLLAQSY